MLHDKPYRVSNVDSANLNESLKDIRTAIYRLCQFPHACMERYCDYCNELQDFAEEMEMKMRKIAKNPISREEAKAYESFMARV